MAPLSLASVQITTQNYVTLQNNSTTHCSVWPSIVITEKNKQSKAFTCGAEVMSRYMIL